MTASVYHLRPGGSWSASQATDALTRVPPTLAPVGDDLACEATVVAWLWRERGADVAIRYVEALRAFADRTAVTQPWRTDVVGRLARIADAAERTLRELSGGAS